MNQRTNSSRSGALLVCVLVCVGIASTIMLTAMSASLRARRQMRHEMQLEQTRWLVEAAMIRGARQIREQEDYQGETWNADAALSGYAEAEATIEVTTEGLKEGQVELRVAAVIRGPDPLSKRTRRSGRLVLDRPGNEQED